MTRFLIPLLLVAVVYAGEVRYDVLQFVQAGLANEPILEETRHGVDAKKNKVRSLKSEVILPTFNVSMMDKSIFALSLPYGSKNFSSMPAFFALS